MVLPRERQAFLQADKPDCRGVCEERFGPALRDLSPFSPFVCLSALCCALFASFCSFSSFSSFFFLSRFRFLLLTPLDSALGHDLHVFQFVLPEIQTLLQILVLPQVLLSLNQVLLLCVLVTAFQSFNVLELGIYFAIHFFQDLLQVAYLLVLPLQLHLIVLHLELLLLQIKSPLL